MDTTDMPSTIQDYEKLYATIFDSLEEMDKFPEIHSLPRLNLEKT